MTADAGQERCADCGAAFTPVDGDAHAYLGASPACWAAFNVILAREFQDAAYFAAHRYTVDAYTVQHPGDQANRRAAQSVNIHLAALCALIEQGRAAASVPHMLKMLANTHKDRFTPLPPPAPEAYALTVQDGLSVKTARHHGEAMRAWAESVWRAWAPHHETARMLVRLYDDR